jgi:hypothetical protein
MERTTVLQELFILIYINNLLLARSKLLCHRGLGSSSSVDAGWSFNRTEVSPSRRVALNIWLRLVGTNRMIKKRSTRELLIIPQIGVLECI